MLIANKRRSTFRKIQGDACGLNKPSFSNGAAFVDLTVMGSLDYEGGNQHQMEFPAFPLLKNTLS